MVAKTGSISGKNQNAWRLWNKLKDVVAAVELAVVDLVPQVALAEPVVGDVAVKVALVAAKVPGGGRRFGGGAGGPPGERPAGAQPPAGETSETPRAESPESQGTPPAPPATPAAEGSPAPQAPAAPTSFATPEQKKLEGAWAGTFSGGMMSGERARFQLTFTVKCRKSLDWYLSFRSSGRQS
jgi:hypothetical protein